MSKPEPTALTRSPHHVAIIMDGNGRWARQRGQPRIAGHRKGVTTIKALLPICARHQIPYLTLFAFSSENWRRPQNEVRFLLELLTTTLENELPHLGEHNIRLRIIGDMSSFPKKLRAAITQATAVTRENRALNLTVAINYGGKWDIEQACRAIADQVAQGELATTAITPSLVASQLCTAGLPDPDLFIRTGGEVRLSNFFLWQLAYTELYFTDTFWPDFAAPDFHEALLAFATRQRRFGGVAADKPC